MDISFCPECMRPLREEAECSCTTNNTSTDWICKVAKSSGKEYYFRKRSGVFQSFGCSKNNKLWIKDGMVFAKNINVDIDPEFDLIVYAKYVEKVLGK